MRWLDPADQARLKGLVFSPRRPAAAQAPGRHRALSRGFSRELSQHRPYAPGDEARSIDWKAYARLDRYYVRESRAEDRAALVVAVDLSASMTFSGGGRPSKLDAARRAAAGLCWLALAQGDEAGLSFFGGSGPRVPPRAGAGQLSALDAALGAASPGGTDSLPEALEAAAAALPPRAAVVVVSDLLGDTARVLRALRRASSGRRDLRVLRVLDPDERDFPYEGALRVEGLEGGALSLDAASAGPAYRAAFARQEAAYRAALARLGAPYATAPTDSPWTGAVGRLLGA